MTHLYFPYATTEVFCIIFAAIIWMRMNRNIGSEHEVRQLRNMIYSYLVMLVFDVLWAVAEDKVIHPAHLQLGFINAITLIAISCGCYFWFKFIEDRLHFAPAARKTIDRLLLIPLAAICILDFTSIFTGWIFYIDAQGSYQMAAWFNLQTIVNYFYLLIPTVYSAYRAVTTHSRQDRAEYWTYTLYMIAPLISGQLEDYLPHVPILALNIFMVILILFLMIQNMQIYNDALTGLNNRRRLNIYLEETLPKATVQRPMLLFIMDIDNFKSINDAYGHLEGDSALKAFSDAMKDVAIRYSAFIARYGGDEFCMVMDACGKSPETVAEDIRQSLRNTHIKCQAADDSYKLMASIGFAVCDGTEQNPELELARADRMLYEEKAQKAHQRTAAV